MISCSSSSVGYLYGAKLLSNEGIRTNKMFYFNSSRTDSGTWSSSMMWSLKSSSGVSSEGISSSDSTEKFSTFGIVGLVNRNWIGSFTRPVFYAWFTYIEMLSSNVYMILWLNEYSSSSSSLPLLFLIYIWNLHADPHLNSSLNISIAYLPVIDNDGIQITFGSFVSFFMALSLTSFDIVILHGMKHRLVYLVIPSSPRVSSLSSPFNFLISFSPS